MKFKDFAEEFFTKRRSLVLAKELAPPSFRSDEIRFSKLLPFFAEVDLRDCSSIKIDKFLDQLILEGRSPGTRNRYRALLHTYFKYAIRRKHCEFNPVSEIPILSEKLKTRKVGYWGTEAEVDLYVAEAFLHGDRFGLGAAVLAYGGCRISELLALTFGDIEWDLSYIRINKLVERHTGQSCERTKGQGAGGEYQIILLPRLREILLRYRREPDALIVADALGNPMTYDMFYRKHFEIVAAAGLKRITPHDLRRTFASLAQVFGFHISEVGELLGHETLASTKAYLKMDVSHLVEKAKRVGFGK